MLTFVVTHSASLQMWSQNIKFDNCGGQIEGTQITYWKHNLWPNVQKIIIRVKEQFVAFLY